MPITVPSQEQYREFFSKIKSKIRDAQYSALRAVNQELIGLYWDIGEAIVLKQQEQGWGKAVVQLLAQELQVEFVRVQGFSVSNLWRMRNLYLSYKDNPKLAPLVREVSWSHNVAIIEKCKDTLEREYYLQRTRKESWSRDTLSTAITNQSYEKFLLSQTNFDKTLRGMQHQHAKLAVKDEYTFNFLGLEDDHLEKDIEHGLIKNIRRFLSEMGSYFTFIGNQYRIEVDKEEYFIDLLLFHRKLKCLVAIELKKVPFQPEHAGKMLFYLSALDDTVRLEDENPSIGIIVCREKSRTRVEYTLRNIERPYGDSNIHHKSISTSRS